MKELKVFKEFLQEENKPSPKKMYSEEEVEIIARDAYSMGKNNILIGVFNKWFQQFKKKQYTPKLYFIQRLIRSF